VDLKSKRIRGYHEVCTDYDELLDEMDTEEVLYHLATEIGFEDKLAAWIDEAATGGKAAFAKFLLGEEE
jgi:hypothetical protein